VRAGELRLLSEQYLMDCSWPYGNTGCNGGYQEPAFRFAIDNVRKACLVSLSGHACCTGGCQEPAFRSIVTRDNVRAAVLLLPGFQDILNVFPLCCLRRLCLSLAERLPALQQSESRFSIASAACSKLHDTLTMLDADCIACRAGSNLLVGPERLFDVKYLDASPCAASVRSSACRCMHSRLNLQHPRARGTDA
jgi:Papain family cysteine protease